MEHILDVDALDVQLALPVGVVVRRAVEADRDERLVPPLLDLLHPTTSLMFLANTIALQYL